MSVSKVDLIKKLEETRINKVCLEVSKETYDQEKDILVSKIGGIPYWPKGKEYPILETVNAKLIAQLNLDEISKKVDLKRISPYYPSTGILQFFISEDTWGLDGSAIIIYHENTNEEHLLTEEQIETNLMVNGMPYEESIRLHFVESDELLGLEDKVHPEFNSIYDIDNKLLGEIHNDLVQNTGSKLGGYGYFTQGDPLEHEELNDEIIMLLQLDSDDALGLLWGDSGVATWRIEKEKLKKLDFSKIYYTWDCC